MTHFDSAQEGCDREARAILRHRASLPPKATAESADRSAAALADVRRQAWRYPLRASLGGVAWMVLAFWLITTYTKSSNPVVLGVEISGMMLGPVLFFFGLGWLFRILARRGQVQLGQWVAYPARAAIMHQGPLRSTVVGLEITPTAMLVIYPEQYFRSRIRRLVEREEQLLVLVSPPQKFGVGSWVEIERGSERFLYAGPSGRLVFAEIASQRDALRQVSEQPALAALAHARGSAL